MDKTEEFETGTVVTTVLPPEVVVFTVDETGVLFEHGTVVTVVLPFVTMVETVEDWEELFDCDETEFADWDALDDLV